MSINVQNAFVAKPMDAGTAFAYAPGLFPLPVDATTALDSGILATDHGAVDEDGFAVAPKRDSDKIKMFGGGVFISTQTGFEETIKITFLEDDNVNVLESVFGESNVIVTPASATAGVQKTIYHSDEELPMKTWVVQAEYEGKSKRFVVEFGKVAEVAETKSTHKEPTKWEITIDVFKGSNGKYVNEYRDDGKKLAGPVVKVFTIGSGVTDYTVTVDGQTTAAVSALTSAALKTALEGLSNVGTGNVNVAGTSGGPLTATFTVPVTVVTAAGTGGTVTVA